MRAVPDVVVFSKKFEPATIYSNPAEIDFAVEIRSESNVGPNWDAKLKRLAAWSIPVAIYEAGELVNRHELPSAVQSHFS